MSIRHYIDMVRAEMLPYQYAAICDRLPDTEPSYAVRNFAIAAGDVQGQRGGTMWQDSDAYKWLEAVGYALGGQWDEELFQNAERVVDLIARSQQPDGYLDTYVTLVEPESRFTNLEQCHELYCAGHLIEAAVAYARGTGRTRFLEVACRLADLICLTFGPNEGQVRGYPGHEEIELALVKLYRQTGVERYLHTAKYFIDERGASPNFFLAQREARGGKSVWGGFFPLNYYQADKPVREQDKAVGHAVRAVYLYTAMADLAMETADEGLAAACDRLWADVAHKQMYVTGAIGSSCYGEAFSEDYHLPNERAYAETCASVGLIFFAGRMAKLRRRGEYGDVMERALYNSVLSGIAYDAHSFFYVTPLEVKLDVSGRPAGEGDPALRDIMPRRQKWYGCACCPPNAARLLMSLSEYALFAAEEERTAYLNLYLHGTLKIPGLELRVDTRYPEDGHIAIEVAHVDADKIESLALRVPAFAGGLNADALRLPAHLRAELREGFCHIKGGLRAGDAIELDLPLCARFTRANPRVAVDVGMVALERGPVVYCAEGADNPFDLFACLVDTQDAPVERRDEGLFGGCTRLRVKGWQVNSPSEDLYASAKPALIPREIEYLPYHLFANREAGDMRVWMREKL